MTLIGRWLFAAAFVAFGLQQFLWGDFVPGRAPAWPAAIPGRLIWADGSGVFFVLAGLSIAAGRRSRPAALAIAGLVFGWAFLRNVPLALADLRFGAAWTALGKGLALSGGALAVAGSAEGDRTSGPFELTGRVCLGAFLVASGVQHFLFAGLVARPLRVWIPGALFWTHFAGAALIAGGIGLNVPKTRSAAAVAVGCMVFSWVFLLHIPRALAALPAARRNEWTAVFEAVAVAGIAFVLSTHARTRIRT